jgi:hypothetical protein
MRSLVISTLLFVHSSIDPKSHPITVGNAGGDVLRVGWYLESAGNEGERLVGAVGLEDLRTWCAAHYGCGIAEIKLWYEG